MESRTSGRAVHDGYGTPSWQTNHCIWICIITTQPQLYANEVHPVQRSRLAKLRSNCQTRQCWSNMDQDSATAFPISHVKCFQKHVLVYCLAVIWESLWRGHHAENRGRTRRNQNKEHRSSDNNTHRGSDFIQIANRPSCLLTSNGAECCILYI